MPPRIGSVATRRRTRAGTVLGAAAALLAALAILLLPALASAAPAHTTVLSTSPSAGEVVDTAPEAIEVRFLDAVLPSPTIVVLDAGGHPVGGDAAVELDEAGTTARRPVDDLGPGTFEVRLDFASLDGAPQADAWTFEVAGAGSASPTSEVAARPDTPTTVGDDAPAAVRPSSGGDLDLDLDWLRLTLHVLAATVWVGGQLVLAGLVPTIRGIDPEAPRLVARAFGRIAWPAFGVLVATGIWNLSAVSVGDRSTTYQVVLLVKLVVVAASGLSAAAHGTARSKLVLAVGGAVAFVSALGALGLGVLLAHG